jgi:hypothetical protein
MDAIEKGLEKALVQMRKVKPPHRTKRLVELQSLTEQLLAEMRNEGGSLDRINELTEQIKALQ